MRRARGTIIVASSIFHSPLIKNWPFVIYRYKIIWRLVRTPGLRVQLNCSHLEKWALRAASCSLLLLEKIVTSKQSLFFFFPPLSEYISILVGGSWWPETGNPSLVAHNCAVIVVPLANRFHSPMSLQVFGASFGAMPWIAVCISGDWRVGNLDCGAPCPGFVFPRAACVSFDGFRLFGNAVGSNLERIMLLEEKREGCWMARCLLTP